MQYVFVQIEYICGALVVRQARAIRAHDEPGLINAYRQTKVVRTSQAGGCKLCPGPDTGAALKGVGGSRALVIRCADDCPIGGRSDRGLVSA